MLSKFSILVLTIIIGWSALVEAGQSVNLPMNSTDISGQVELGNFQIDSIGTVHLTANREGSRLIVVAVGDKGGVIGKAETTIGLKETPIYLQGENGLQSITLRWGTNKQP
jgi:hypothetical protein